MFERDIYTIHSTYREDMHIKGFQFGKGEKSACIVGAARGNEIQQMYICSQLVKTLRELENNGCISAGKQILVIPTINAYSVNISRRFFGVKEADINRSFPGNDYGEPADRLTNAYGDQRLRIRHPVYVLLPAGRVCTACAYDGDGIPKYFSGKSVRTALCGGEKTGAH